MAQYMCIINDVHHGEVYIHNIHARDDHEAIVFAQRDCITNEHFDQSETILKVEENGDWRDIQTGKHYPAGSFVALSPP